MRPATCRRRLQSVNGARLCDLLCGVPSPAGLGLSCILTWMFFCPKKAFTLTRSCGGDFAVCRNRPPPIIARRAAGRGMDLDSALQTLGLEEGVTDSDLLKRAFKKAAFQAHPDKNGGEERRFREVLDAYALLSGESRYSQATRQRKQSKRGSDGGSKAGSDAFNPQYGYVNADLDDVWSEIGFNPYTGETFAPRPPKQQADETPKDESEEWEAGVPGFSSRPLETDVSSWQSRLQQKGFRDEVYEPRRAPQDVSYGLSQLSVADWIQILMLGVVLPVCAVIVLNDPDLRNDVCERRESMSGKEIKGCELDGGPANVFPPRSQ